MIEEEEVGVAMALTEYIRPLMALFSFKYLGRVLSSSYNDWTSVIRNFLSFGLVTVTR